MRSRSAFAMTAHEHAVFEALLALQRLLSDGATDLHGRGILEAAIAVLERESQR